MQCIASYCGHTLAVVVVSGCDPLFQLDNAMSKYECEDIGH